MPKHCTKENNEGGYKRLLHSEPEAGPQDTMECISKLQQPIKFPKVSPAIYGSFYPMDHKLFPIILRDLGCQATHDTQGPMEQG